MSKYIDYQPLHVDEIDYNKCKWLYNEVWKDIKGYEGKYQISNTGRVRSMCNNGKKREEPFILKPIKHYKGYLRVYLWKNSKQKTFLIHRLVAEAFIPNPNNYLEINHKDENKQNNNVNNLEWCTRKYNMNYNGLNKKRNSKKIIQYDIKNNFIKEWECIMEVQRQLGINNANICQCCKGNYKTAGGFIWKYKQ